MVLCLRVDSLWHDVSLKFQWSSTCIITTTVVKIFTFLLETPEIPHQLCIHKLPWSDNITPSFSFFQQYFFVSKNYLYEYVNANCLRKGSEIFIPCMMMWHQLLITMAKYK